MLDPCPDGTGQITRRLNRWRKAKKKNERGTKAGTANLSVLLIIQLVLVGDGNDFNHSHKLIELIAWAVRNLGLLGEAIQRDIDGLQKANDTGKWDRV